MKARRLKFVCITTRAETDIGYPFEIHYPDKGFELFRIVGNYFKQL